ncbi:efflux RND transporter periplasmic adaptor subunit [Vulgatibacter sp.]|uniref:efflux RND transporter periplasmic adaptor subunit n=1 Tax=Vulgatibacter sp. TaxID=1971226 RepID=UPI003562D938
MLRRQGKWIALGLIVLVAIGFLVARLLGEVVPVVEASRRELVQSLVVTGRVLAPARIEVGPLTSGNVAELLVEEGDPVERGQLLLRLDDAEEQAAVAQARAALEQALARQAQLRSVQLPQARAGVRRAEAELEQARRQYQRYAELHRVGALAQSSLDEAQRRLEVAEAEADAARLSRQSAGAGGVEARLAAAAVENAEAALQLAEARLARTRLEAPVNGVVLARDVEVGDAVQPGRVLLLVGASGDTEIEIEPDERNLARLAVGQRALVSADAFPDRQFPAVVKRIAPAVDPARGTVDVRLAVPEPPAYLRPEMTVSADVAVARKADALVLPAEALRDLGTAAPWVLVIDEGRAARRQVQLGLRGESYVEVLEGVAPGEAVILPEAGVEAGARVRAGAKGNEPAAARAGDGENPAGEAQVPIPFPAGERG